MRFDLAAGVVSLIVGLVLFMAGELWVGLLAAVAGVSWLLAYWSARPDVSDHERKSRP